MRSVLKLLISWYCLRLPFPKKGEKYFIRLLRNAKLEKERFVKKLAGNLVMELSAFDHIERHLLWYGFYEKSESRTMQTFISSNTIFIDIGANVGYYTLLAAHIIKNGQVYSFEPVSSTFNKLLRNISLNGFSTIQCTQKAISNFNGKANVFISNDCNSGMSGLQFAENFSGKTEIIDCITLDQAVEDYRIPKVNIIKIDVEGSEVNILKGMEMVLNVYKPILLIEISAETLAMHNEKIGTVYDLLFAKKYVAFQVIDINVLKQVYYPQEADMMFFFPDDFIFPAKIGFIN